MKSSYIVNSARRTLRDDFSQTQANSDVDFVDYINRAVKFIVNADSSASVQTSDITLVSGSLQTLPSNGVRLLKVFYNNIGVAVKKRIGVRRYNGQNSVKELSLRTLQSQIPDWSGAKSSPIVVHYVFNKDDPTSFIVYPPNDGEGKVVASWSFIPAEITEISDLAAGEVLLPERFFSIILNYVMGLCLIRDGETTINRERGREMMQSVAAELGVKNNGDNGDTPPDTVKE